MQVRRFIFDVVKDHQSTRFRLNLKVEFWETCAPAAGNIVEIHQCGQNTLTAIFCSKTTLFGS